MKIRILLLTLVASLLFVSSAEASSWYVSFGQAQNAAKAYVKASCAADSECIAWGLTTCRRRSSARFDCPAARFYRDSEGAEIECNFLARVGVSYGHYVQVKNESPEHCFYPH